jgi:hypothetical protein
MKQPLTLSEFLLVLYLAISPLGQAYVSYRDAGHTPRQFLEVIPSYPWAIAVTLLALLWLALSWHSGSRRVVGWMLAVATLVWLAKSAFGWP